MFHNNIPIVRSIALARVVTAIATSTTGQPQSTFFRPPLQSLGKEGGRDHEPPPRPTTCPKASPSPVTSPTRAPVG